MAEYDNQIPLKLQLLRIGLGGKDDLGIYTYQIEGHNTNYAMPHFCLAPADATPYTMDIVENMEQTMDNLLVSASPDDVREIMGLTLRDELDEETLADEEAYTDIDRGWCLDGQLLSFDRIPSDASDVHAILTDDQIAAIEELNTADGGWLAKAEAIANDPSYRQTADHDRNPLHDLITGGWRVHLVQEGERYGVNGNLIYGDTIGSGAPHIGERINDCQLYGHGLPLVEFYDMTKNTEQGGQFVSRYYMSTLLGMDESGTPLSDMNALSLDGGVPSWTVAGTDLQNVTDWLNTAKETLQPSDDGGQYRLSYDEVTNGLIEQENPYTGLPEVASTGDGFHTTVRLERYDPDYGEWDEIDSESVDGPDAEASAPYDAAERRILARNGLEARRIEVVAPWDSHTIDPASSPAASAKSVSLSTEAKSARDSSQALEGHAPDAPTHENQR